MRYSCIVESGEYISGEVIDILDLPEMQVVKVRLGDGSLFDCKKMRRPTPLALDTATPSDNEAALRK